MKSRQIRLVSVLNDLWQPQLCKLVMCKIYSEYLGIWFELFACRVAAAATAAAAVVWAAVSVLSLQSQCVVSLAIS